MRISSQNSQFIFSFPVDFVSARLYAKFQKFLDTKHMPYDNVLDYLNSTIKEIIMPGLTYENVEQRIKYGKKMAFRSSTNVFDTYQQELDITFRSVDSHMNYFMMQEIMQEFYQTAKRSWIPFLSLHILDTNGDLLYTVIFKNNLLKTLSEQRLTYQNQDFSEKPFTMTFRFNYLDILYELKDSFIDGTYLDDTKSIFNLPEREVKGQYVDDNNRWLDSMMFTKKPNPNL
jgi:hypothetical protein